MKGILMTLCFVVIACMTWVTTVASLDRSVLNAGTGLWPDPWFLATLLDAYFGFLTFFVWVAYKEPSWLARGAWLVAILMFGNFAMSGYLLWQLSKIEKFSWDALLLRHEPAI
ncbi:hypothetical protein Poly59_18670 [Rubripirellula reticaptiva]|uniref:DUF1475 domain-containing protein n=2 Tax=Rubripirellula reticaptiva TaxID=2528013 RepID=A0A5C6F540_9BACT|nr:hypothetical protein Poly59_18670 [Rubripirellula reticaptiva]